MEIATETIEHPATALERKAPFRRSEQARFEVTLSGVMPRWLEGDLVRTCPAVFSRPGWKAEHWFDGLGMLYAFRVGNGEVAYRQRVMATRFAAQADAGNVSIGSFATRTQRGLLGRVARPIPEVTDNANVHVLPFGDDLVALTEGPHQLRIDRTSLEVKGRVEYGPDAVGASNMLAHAQVDFGRNTIVNLATDFGPTCTLRAYEHAPSARERRVIGTWKTKRMPYVHSFGLTDSAVVLVDHPLRVRALDMLFSNAGFIDHFEWEPSAGSRFVVLGRDGTVRTHETDALFVFHTVNAFERGHDIVLDALAYDTAQIVQKLRVPALARDGLPELDAKLARFVLSPGARAVREDLCATPFEFPQVAYRAVSGKPYRVCWGASVGASCSVLRVDVETGETKAFAPPGYFFGEPIFVRRPDGEREDDGVLLVVANARDGKKTTLFVLDASSMEEIAAARLEADVPLGFHGSFLRA